MRYLFLAIALTVWSLLNGYVVWRVASAWPFAGRVRRRWWFGAGAALWLSFPLGMLLGHAGAGRLADAAAVAGTTWLGVVFLLMCPLLALDLATGFGLWWRRGLARLRGGALLAGLVLSGIALVQGLRPPVIHEEEVQLAGLPAEADGLVVVMLSDLHLGAGRGAGWLRARVEQVRDLKPDLVLLAGDVLEGDAPERERELVPLLGELTAPLGVFAVGGNHERHGGGAGRADPWSAPGITWLHDAWREVRPGLLLAGVDDPGHGFGAAGAEGSQDRALAGRPADAATVLLSHRPDRAERAARAGVGLMLSGHTHGGQIWPFDYLVAIENPRLEGRFAISDMVLLVSCGTGGWGPHMRLWSPNEILRITLRAAPA